MIATTALDLASTVVIILGIVAAIGSIVFGCAYTSIKATETNRELDHLRAHEQAETERHRITLEHEARQRSLDRTLEIDQKALDREAAEQAPPEPRWRRMRRAI